MSQPLPDDLARCLAEQLAARDYILSGAPDRRGARLGMADWCAEEILIRDGVERPITFLIPRNE